MRKPRYSIYDTFRREYLQELLLMRTDDGGFAVVGMKGTRDPAEALRFPGIKSAEGVRVRLGAWSELVILNAKGVIVG